MLKDLVDYVLLFRIKRLHDPKAFEEVYQKYASRLYRFIALRVSDQSLAEELLGDVFLKAWKYLQSEVSVSHLQALLYRIARSSVADHYRSNKGKNQEVALEEAVEVSSEDSGEILSEGFDRELAIETIRQALQEIALPYREVIALRFFEDLSIAEISEALQKSAGAVRVLLHRAQKELVKHLPTNDVN